MPLKTIFVAAPRKRRYDPDNPQSQIVAHDRDSRHPANPAHGARKGEICIDEGHGVKGDPAGKEAPWEVYHNSYISGRVTAGKLVIVESRADDTSDLALSDDDLGSLASLTPMQVAALKSAGFEGVKDLAAELDKGGNRQDALTKIKGIGKATAIALLQELQSRDLIRATE